MTLTEVAVELGKPDLLTDITMPKPRAAVKWAREYVLDLKDVLLAVELYLEHPDELRLQLLTDCIANVRGREAA